MIFMQEISIPEHYEVRLHNGHFDLAQHEEAHTGYYEGKMETLSGEPPQGHIPHGYHWISIPGHYDRHGDHDHYEAPHWALHEHH